MNTKSKYELLQTFLEQNAAAGMAAYESLPQRGGTLKMQYKGFPKKVKLNKEKKDY
jgi:hypothetical protein